MATGPRGRRGGVVRQELRGADPGPPRQGQRPSRPIADDDGQVPQSSPPESPRRGDRATRRAPPGVLVVFGASGDLTSRKLLPAIGQPGPAPAAARLVRGGRRGAHGPRRRGVPGLMMEAVPDAAGLGRGRQAQPLRVRRLRRPGHLRPAQGGPRRAGQGARPSRQPHLLPGDRPGRVRRGRPGARRRPGSTTPAARRVGSPGDREALRPGPGQRPTARRRPAPDLRRDADLPDRPLPREGDGPERPGPALRQRHLRAALEPPLRRPRADHRRRVPRRRAPRRLLRDGRRVPRHRAEPRHAGAVADPDGAARQPSTPRASATRRSRPCGRS